VQTAEATVLPLKVLVYLHSSITLGSERHTYFEAECAMAIQDHKRLLISVPIKSTDATSY